MDDEVVAYVRRGYLFTQAVRWGIVLLSFGFGLSLVFVGLPLLPALLVGLSVVFFVDIPLVRTETEFCLVADRSPAEVREEIQSVDNPLAIWAYARANEGGVEIHENGATYETTQLFGLHTTRVRYEAEQRSNGDLLVRLWENDRESMAATVSVEPADGTGTLLTVGGERSGRMGLQTLLTLWVRWRYHAAAYEAHGYEVVNGESRVEVR